MIETLYHVVLFFLGGGGKDKGIGINISSAFYQLNGVCHFKSYQQWTQFLCLYS